MPTSWTERERAFEAKFAHDAEFGFLVRARRDRLFAQWAAGRLHLSINDGAQLIREALAITDKAGHDEALLAHIASAFERRDAHVTRNQLTAQLASCEQTARQQMLEKKDIRPDWE